MSSNIEIEGLGSLVKKLERIGSLDVVKAGMKAAGLHVKGKIAKYPPRKYLPQPFNTDKQRRFFFAALKDGRIEVPYRRGQSPGSEDLGQKWTVKDRKGGLVVIIGNNASYGPYVQDPANQSGYMAAVGWKTTDEVAKEETAAANKILAQAIDKALAKG